MGLYRALAAIGLGLATLSGCVMSAAPTKDYYDELAKAYSERRPAPSQPFSVRPEFRAGFDVAYVKAKLPKELRTAPAHPDIPDSTETVTNNPRGVDVRPKVGAYLSAGSWLRVFAGGDVRWSFNSAKWSLNTDRSPYNVQDPKEDGAYSYVELIPKPLTLVPTVGVEANLAPITPIPLKLHLEAGAPYSGFDLNSGYRDSDGKRNTVDERDWKGFGRRAAAGLFLDTTPRAGLMYGYESYEPDFGDGPNLGSLDAEVESHDFVLWLDWPF